MLVPPMIKKRPMSNGLTFDESNARLTDVCTGRTIDKIYRKGLDLIIVFTDNIEVTIAADVDYNICYKNHETRVYIPGLAMGSELGNLGG